MGLGSCNKIVWFSFNIACYLFWSKEYIMKTMKLLQKKQQRTLGAIILIPLEERLIPIN